MSSQFRLNHNKLKVSYKAWFQKLMILTVKGAKRSRFHWNTTDSSSKTWKPQSASYKDSFIKRLWKKRPNLNLKFRSKLLFKKNLKPLPKTPFKNLKKSLPNSQRKLSCLDRQEDRLRLSQSDSTRKLTSRSDLQSKKQWETEPFLLISGIINMKYVCL